MNLNIIHSWSTSVPKYYLIYSSISEMVADKYCSRNSCNFELFLEHLFYLICYYSFRNLLLSSMKNPSKCVNKMITVVLLLNIKRIFKCHACNPLCLIPDILTHKKFEIICFHTHNIFYLLCKKSLTKAVQKFHLNIKEIIFCIKSLLPFKL